MAHKAEHAVDMDTGAVVAVTLQGADQGDTTTLDITLSEAGMAVAEQIGREAEQRLQDQPQVNVNGIEEVVADKGYHSGAVLERLKSLSGTQLHSGEATKRTTEVAGQAGGTAGGVPESAASARRVRQEFTAAARRVAGT